MEQILAQFLKGKALPTPTPEEQRSRRQARQIREEQLIRSLSISMCRSQGSKCLTPQATSPSSVKTTNPKSSTANKGERIKLLKARTDAFRDFVDSFDFHTKMKTMLLRNSNKHKIRNLTNFQYSLGNPKKRIFDRTSINIYGYRGDLISIHGEKLGRNFYFKNSDNRFLLSFPKLPKTFFIAQSDSIVEPEERRTVELGLLVETDCTRTVLILMNYSRKKILIKFKGEFSGDYCSIRKKGIYNDQNFNMPLVNRFNSKQIQVLNYHKCIKHGNERIINKVDLIKRKMMKSREIGAAFDSKEKLGDLMKLKGTDKYAFLNYFREDLLKITLYDYNRDERKELGFVKTESDVLMMKGSNVSTQLIYINEMEGENLKKMKTIYSEFRNKMYDLEDIKSFIYEKADLNKSRFSDLKALSNVSSSCDSSDRQLMREFEEDFLAVLDITLNAYRSNQNVLFFIRKDFSGLTLDVDEQLRLSPEFGKIFDPASATS